MIDKFVISPPNPNHVIPAKAGIQIQWSGSRLPPGRCLDPGFRPRMNTFQGRLGDDFLRVHHD